MTAEEQEAATYYTAEVGHERQGPWTYGQMAAMVLGGHSTTATLWWRPGMPEWQRICTFPLPPQKYNLINASWAGLRRAVRFSGRSGRAEFWFFTLGMLLCYIALFIVNGYASRADYTVEANLFWVSFAFMVYCGVALLAAATRRLHDAGLTALLLLFLLVPVLGPIGLAAFLAFPPQNTNNPYGSRPLYPED